MWFSGMDGEEFWPDGKEWCRRACGTGPRSSTCPSCSTRWKDYNDELPCLWRDGATNWLFGGGRMGLNEVPFKVGSSRPNNGAAWTNGIRPA